MNKRKLKQGRRGKLPRRQDQSQLRVSLPQISRQGLADAFIASTTKKRKNKDLLEPSDAEDDHTPPRKQRRTGILADHPSLDSDRPDNTDTYIPRSSATLDTILSPSTTSNPTTKKLLALTAIRANWEANDLTNILPKHSYSPSKWHKPLEWRVDILLALYELSKVTVGGQDDVRLRFEPQFRGQGGFDAEFTLRVIRGLRDEIAAQESGDKGLIDDADVMQEATPAEPFSDGPNGDLEEALTVDDSKAQEEDADTPEDLPANTVHAQASVDEPMDPTAPQDHLGHSANPHDQANAKTPESHLSKASQARRLRHLQSTLLIANNLLSQAEVELHGLQIAREQASLSSPHDGAARRFSAADEAVARKLSDVKERRKEVLRIIEIAERSGSRDEDMELGGGTVTEQELAEDMDEEPAETEIVPEVVDEM